MTGLLLRDKQKCPHESNEKAGCCLTMLTKANRAGHFPTSTLSTVSSEMGHVEVTFNLAKQCMMVVTHPGQQFSAGDSSALWRTFSNIYRDFWFSHLEVGGHYWHLVGRDRLQMLLNILQATGEVTTMSNYLHCQWPKMLILLRVRNRHRRPRNERGNLWKHYRQGFFLFCGMFWFLFCDGSPVESFTLFYCVVIVLPLSGGWVGVQG